MMWITHDMCLIHMYGIHVHICIHAHMYKFVQMYILKSTCTSIYLSIDVSIRSIVLSINPGSIYMYLYTSHLTK